ncbi:GntR family transcriptional regulator [Maribellus maritimus]|uniref:GntR family transcriptional regulator n=1 Tax=Maribellus maritimus TaxID=2870838 RepID=UPI001EEB9DE1|nr:GntR family transcriptional regulator [Maribellus maritimus]MCG6187973.1 GntR family transcriptional regulator [Maribellus maritimus]
MKFGPKYLLVKNFLKESIQQGKFKVGDFLPSEHELCSRFSVTRTTTRKALDELIKEGYIEKLQGKGSRVKERRKSLGLLTVKGFSEAVGKNVNTIFLTKPQIGEWKEEIIFPVKKEDKDAQCIFFERLRCVNSLPVMLERNWLPATILQGFTEKQFVDESFFKTLSQEYLIEITGSKQEIRAEYADDKIAEILSIERNSPVLHISVLFSTNQKKLTIYSELFCNTTDFPVGNQYFM